MPALAAPPETGHLLLQTLLSLGLVVALLLGSLWLLRRFRIGQSGPGSLLKVVASTAVGPRENVVVVELGEEWLVLGVAPGQVRLLHTCPRASVASTDTTAPAAFAARLLESLRRPR
ncbi:MAG: flagellar biosynthetic protein FliO [Rhodocyclaceae bacterium]|nr:flagellar biosynthetic protein FliO [Rhodocyclaceae bacterium]